MQNTDERNPTKIDDIIAYLDGFGIRAERTSVKNDIDEINFALYMLEEGCTVDVAVDDLSGDFSGDKFIQTTPNRREFFVSRRRHDISEENVRLLAECVYAARFIDDKTAKELIDIACSLINCHSALRIKHDFPLLSKPRTLNKDTIRNLSTINFAMSPGLKGSGDAPQKITFRYQKHCINDIYNTVDRRNGATYKVSPYKILIDDGNFYLLAFDDRSQEMRTYRVDRMKSVNLTNEPRDGEDVFNEESIKDYSLRVFGMFSGERQNVTLLFDDCLLDAVIDRFGRKGIAYSRYDDEHFTISPEIEISDQFFAWICRFGDMVKILEPEAVKTDFKEYLDRIRSLY